MEELITSIVIALVLLALVLRDVLRDHGLVLRATVTTDDLAHRDGHRTGDGPLAEAVAQSPEAEAAA
jgi:hypothetical protein